METQPYRFKNGADTKRHVDTKKSADAAMPPAEGPVLLHCCCAPCSTAILEWMAGRRLRPCVFFSNSNIVPLAEYEKRREELVRYARHYGFEAVDDDYDHAAWLSSVKAGCAPDAPGSLPERSRRCLSCFRFRLGRAAEYAATHGFTVLTTTLASSRWKDLAQVDAAGLAACADANARTAAATAGSTPAESSPAAAGGRNRVAWWGRNWRKGGLQDRRSCLIREWRMYNQLYCGCEFSMATGAASLKDSTHPCTTENSSE